MAIKLSKYSIIGFLLYVLWYKEAYGNISILLYGTVAIATTFVFLDIAYKRRLRINRFICMLFLFGISSFFTGIFVCSDYAWFISTMITYFAFAIVCFDIFYIISEEENGDWLTRTLCAVAVLCSVQTIFFGADYKTEVIVRTMGIDNNPNTLGLTMILGIFALVSRKQNATKRFVLNVALIMVFLIVIVLSGSRKSLICALLLVTIWIFSILRTEKRFSIRKTIISITIILAIIGAVYYVLNYYVYSASFARLQMAFNRSGATSTRIQMFMYGISLWKTSPVIGVGFGQYQILAPFHTYSHSTYAEILACTGLVGSIIFFIPLIRLVFRYGKKIFSRNTDNKYDYYMCFVMLLVELFLGFGQIFIYDIGHLVILTYIAISLDYIDIENSHYRSTLNSY